MGYTCITKGYVGEWARQEIEVIGAASDRDHSAVRSQRAGEIADSLTGEEDVVALFTTEDPRGDRMWLMKPKGTPWTVEENYTCPKSGEKYGAGERVLKGEYYEKVARSKDLYEFRPDLGVLSVPARMLRAGGMAEPIQLELQAPRSDRHTRKFYKLHEDSSARITDLIVNMFKDKNK